MTVLAVVAVWMGIALVLALILGAAIRIADDNEQHCQQEDQPTPERWEQRQ